MKENPLHRKGRKSFYFVTCKISWQKWYGMRSPWDSVYKCWTDQPPLLDAEEWDSSVTISHECSKYWFIACRIFVNYSSNTGRILVRNLRNISFRSALYIWFVGWAVRYFRVSFHQWPLFCLSFCLSVDSSIYDCTCIAYAATSTSWFDGSQKPFLWKEHSCE